MGTFDITSSNISSQYNYNNENVIVVGNVKQDAETRELQSISGTAYRKDQHGEMGECIGNFNGNANNGVVKYSLSEMSHQDSDLVWSVIDEIEADITGDN